MSTKPGAPEVRLHELLEQRLQAGADVATIDRRIWELFGDRRAIMFTDLAGFSRGVADFGIIHFLELIHEHRRLLEPVIDAHAGAVLSAHADSLLVTFERPDFALSCAVAMQHACQRVSAQRKPEDQLLLCVGVGYGDVLRVGDSDMWGAEVNAASKLGEDTAKAHEIVVTGAVREAVGDVPNLSFVELATVPPGADGCFRVEYGRSWPP